MIIVILMMMIIIIVIIIMIIIVVVIIAAMIMMMKIILIIAVAIIINSPFQPGDFSTGSTTIFCIIAPPITSSCILSQFLWYKLKFFSTKNVNFITRLFQTKVGEWSSGLRCCN